MPDYTRCLRRLRKHAGNSPPFCSGWLAFIRLAVALLVLSCRVAGSQDFPSDWRARVRQYAQAKDWTSAMRIVEQAIARAPQDTDAWAWRARVLTWSGNLAEAENEYLKILSVSRKDPDIWMGLATVRSREGKAEEALNAARIAVELDPTRADLHVLRARVLQAAANAEGARREFQIALGLDSTSAEARTGLNSLRGEPKHELRFGEDNDLFNFAGAYHSERISLTSKWSQRWSTSLAGDLDQRGGVDAGKFVASVTGRFPKYGALTVGGAKGHDGGVIPRSEAFFELDRAWKLSETSIIRGIEWIYGQHWYWYQGSRVLTLNGTAMGYLPKEWTISLSGTGARSTFPRAGAEWRPSGVTRIGFPLAHWSDRRLSGNVLFATGSENFASVDQIGNFASQSYGGGLRFQIGVHGDIRGYASYQKRTQDRTDISFGLSYGIYF